LDGTRLEPITQALLGAATAGVVAGRTLGRRALVIGALVGMSPDLDVVLGPLRNGYGEWLYHRGTTHSLWFGFVAGPALGWLLWRWRDPERQTPLSAWISLCIVALVTHPILDGFTPYGTQFFAPFSRARFAWNGVAIVDPVYSLLLGSGVVYGCLRPFETARARRFLILSLAISSLYLVVGLVTNARVVEQLEIRFERAGHDVERVRAYPTIFQPWLRHFVVRANGERIVGFHSLLQSDCPSWKTHPQPSSDARIEAVLASPEGRLLAWFADGDYGIEERAIPFGTMIRMDDLRYAWSNQEGRGLWGLEARFDRDGVLEGPVKRFSTRSLGDREIHRLWRAIRGELPAANVETGWQTPAECSRARIQLGNNFRDVPKSLLGELR